METAEDKVIPRRPTRWGKRRLPEEVNRILRDYDSGMSAQAIAERHGVSKSTLYRWIAQFEDQRTVDDDVVCQRMRIAELEKTVLHLAGRVAAHEVAASGMPAGVRPVPEPDNAT